MASGEKESGKRPVRVDTSLHHIHQDKLQSELLYERGRSEMYLDLAGFMILGLDLEGKIEVLNRKGCEIIGCDEPPIGRSWFDFIPERMRKEIMEAFRLLREGDGLVKEYENMIVRANGEERLISWRNTVLRDKEGKVIGTLSSGEDITEHRKREEELRAAKDILESLIDYANAPIVVWDPAHLITGFNHAFEHLTGYRAEEVYGRSIELLFPEDSVGWSLTMIDRTSKGEHWDSVEIPILRKDGTVRTILWNSATLFSPVGSRILMTIAQGQDITDRKKAEKALKESEERFHTLADNVPQLEWMADGTGYIVWYNKQWYDYTGTTPEQMEGWGWQSVHDPEMLPKVVEKWKSSISTGQPFHMVFPLRGADGIFRPFLTRILPVKNEQGEVVRWFGTNTDITEELEIRRRLEHSNAELQQFAYVSSHDLQEPLRMVVSYLTLLERKYRDINDPNAKEYIRGAMEGGLRMRNLIDDLLEYSRVDSRAKEFTMVNMSEVLVSTIKLLKVPIEESKADILIGPMPSILGDEAQLVQLMQNLIGNSIKFRTAERPIINVSAESGTREWIFKIKDNGIGLNPEYSEKIFQMFQRLHTKEEYPGTGVGLAIAKKIVERHGGRIWVESEEGKGASFFFTILKAKADLPREETSLGLSVPVKFE
jgi:PAS domain S-box-containing protein